MFLVMNSYPIDQTHIRKGGKYMTKKQLLSAIAAGAVLFSSVGCSFAKKENKKQELKELRASIVHEILPLIMITRYVSS